MHNIMGVGTARMQFAILNQVWLSMAFVYIAES